MQLSPKCVQLYRRHPVHLFLKSFLLSTPWFMCESFLNVRPLTQAHLALINSLKDFFKYQLRSGAEVAVRSPAILDSNHSRQNTVVILYDHLLDRMAQLFRRYQVTIHRIQIQMPRNLFGALQRCARVNEHVPLVAQLHSHFAEQAGRRRVGERQRAHVVALSDRVHVDGAVERGRDHHVQLD